MADDGPAAKKACLAIDALEKLTKEELIAKYVELVASAETASAEGRSVGPISAAELAALRESEEKLRQQHAEATRRENILIKTLTSKEQELAECASQIEELKQYQLPSNAQLRTVLLDPTVNLMFQRMRKELDASKAKLEESQNELSAWKFTPDSQTGKRLMARCRMLIQENEELGKQISSGRIAKLEGDIALERALISEMKASQAETDEYLLELDGEMEGMQSTVYLLQQQLREAKEQLTLLRADNAQLTLRCSRAEAAAAAAAAAVAVAPDDESPRSPHSRTSGRRVDEDAAAEASLEDKPQQQSESDDRTEGSSATASTTTTVGGEATSDRTATDAEESRASCATPAEAMEVEAADARVVSVETAPPALMEDVCSVHVGDDCSRVGAALPSPGTPVKGSRQSDEDAARLSPPPRGSGESANEDVHAQPAVQPHSTTDGVVKPPPPEGTPRQRLRSARGSEASGTDDDVSQHAATGDTPTSPVEDDSVAAASGSTRTPARRSARTKRRRVDATGGGTADGGETAAGLLANGHASS